MPGKLRDEMTIIRPVCARWLRVRLLRLAADVNNKRY